MHNKNCGCCSGVSISTPVSLRNDYGLKAISYRIGNYHDFKKSLLSKLSKTYLDNKGYPSPLKDLTTREADDFTIALLDSWAIVLDILTFYQERIANESYLRTAKERMSVLELARQIGYELKPGIAAETYIAFLLDEATLNQNPSLLTNNYSGDLYSSLIKLNKGIKIQSIPKQDEEPQIFETVEDIEAKLNWNALKLKRTAAYIYDVNNVSELFIQGQDNNISKGSMLAFEGFNSTVYRINEIIEINDLNITKIEIVKNNSTFRFVPNLRLEYAKMVGNYSYSKNAVNVYQNLGTGFNISIFNDSNRGLNLAQIEWALNAPKILAQPITFRPILFRKKAAIFGYNASSSQIIIDEWGSTISKPWVFKEDTKIIYLDTAVENIAVNSYICLINESTTKIYKITDVLESPRTEYGLSNKVTRLTIEGDWLSDFSFDLVKKDITKLRSISVFIQSEYLKISEMPLSEIINKNESELIIDKVDINLKVGQHIIISGENPDLPGVPMAELHQINETTTTHDNKNTIIKLYRGIENKFIRKSVIINANVAKATHGETVMEVLGDGNAAKIFQKFILKQSPLTYVSADTQNGTMTSLEIRVNDILWKEVPYLYDLSPNDKVYITRMNDDGETSIIFGDGKNGSRLPSGQQNVKAYYRFGSGTKGLLMAKQLSTLLNKPLGVKEVVNPFDTNGAQEKEEIDSARENAKLTMYAMDRVVSLKDFEDYARAFSGISKAKAVWLWKGRKKYIHLSIAGINGAEISKSSSIYKNLIFSIKQFGIEGIQLVVDPFVLKVAKVKGKIFIDKTYISEKVLSRIRESIKDKFNFDNRSLGQHLFLNEVSAFISSQPGVIGVDIDSLYIVGNAIMRNDVLLCNLPHSGNDTSSLAELIILETSLDDIVAI
ncbi:MAG: hypothetical protein KA536_15955 [Saprospiraceae bacterium]|nr:hypothetical protein [Saprospiraceae bacterium]